MHQVFQECLIDTPGSNSKSPIKPETCCEKDYGCSSHGPQLITILIGPLLYQCFKVSTAALKSMTKSTLGRKKFVSSCSLQFRKFRAEDLEVGADDMLTALLPVPSSICFLLHLKTTCPGVALPMVDFACGRLYLFTVKMCLYLSLIKS